jgi:hypothetical protein
MTRRPALVTQADVARACRAAKALGSEWFVEIEARTGTIRVMQAPSDPHFARGLDKSGGCSPPVPVAPQRDWRL